MDNYNLDRGFVPTLQSQSVFFFYVEFFVTSLTFLVQISHCQWSLHGFMIVNQMR